MVRKRDGRAIHLRLSRRMVVALITALLAAATLAAVSVPVAGTTAALVPLASGSPKGTLQLRAEFSWTFSVQRDDTTCPAGMPPLAICQPHASTALVPGLGSVSMSYVYAVLPAASCPGSSAQVLGYTARFVVAGKGEVDFAISGLPDCFPAPSAEIQSTTQPFTVTDGSGAYAGASGSGTVRHAGAPGLAGTHGRDLWQGTLVVTGLEFDVSPPTISGAVSKIVRVPRGAKRVRVRYKVAASDTEGAVPVTCTPRSGTFFRLGRTRVTCTATDTNGNTAVRAFTVTVTRRR